LTASAAHIVEGEAYVATPTGPSTALLDRNFEKLWTVYDKMSGMVLECT
jgi:hypothetical protein